jgi:nucleotide-binding universal stress UspA family protein
LIESSLDQAAAHWAKDESLVKRATVPDATAQQVTAYAAAIQAELVVVSAQGVSSDVGKLLNGMVHQVAERAPSPVLVALAPFTGLRRVLLAYDGSPQSQTAARFLTQLPLPPGIVVTVLHVLPEVSNVKVVPPRWPAGARIVWAGRATLENAALDPAEVQRAQDILAEGLGILSQAGLNAQGRLARGFVEEVILREAEEYRADLVVSGSRGLGAIRGWLLGSVSRRLVQSASRSVLIVRED